MIINKDLCNGCTKCVAACPAGAISAEILQRIIELCTAVITLIWAILA